MKQFSKELGKVSVTPKGVWDINTTSERLDIVYDKRNNQAYIAKQNVPVGVDIDNREYWQPMNVTGYADNNFINLTTENENGTITAYESLEEAVATILPINRRVGATLSFYNLNSDRLDRQAEFELWQFNSTDLTNWEIRDYWNNIYYNWNVFAGWYIGADALKNHVKIPNVGQYAYVGTNLNDALLYQCRTNGTWTNTGIKVRNYISVVVSGNITIGENGNWFSDGEDTGIPATPAVDEQLDNIIIQLQQHTTEISNLKKSDANLQDQIASNDSYITSLTAKHESLSKTVQGIAATGGASTATNVTYNNDVSGLNAENAQDAIDELQSSKFDKTSILQELGEAEDKVISQKAVSAKLSDLFINLDNKTLNLSNEINGKYAIELLNGYMDSKGHINDADNESYKHTSKFLVDTNSIYLYTGRYGYGISCPAVLFFDKENNLIDSITYSPKEIEAIDMEVSFEGVRATTKYVVFNSANEPRTPLVIKKKGVTGISTNVSKNTSDIAKLSSDIYGKKEKTLTIELLNGYMDSKGHINDADNESYKHTNYVEVDVSKIYLYTGSYGYGTNCPAVLFFDKDKHIIDSIIAEGQNRVSNLEIDFNSEIRKNTVYVVFNSESQATYPLSIIIKAVRGLTEEIQDTKNSIFSPYSEIVYGAIGDSITNGYFADLVPDNEADLKPSSTYPTDPRKNYAYNIKKYFKIKKYYNYGRDGRSIGKDYGFADTTHSNNTSLITYDKLADDLTHISIWFGWNDANASVKTPLGEINDNTHTTWCGAWNIVLRELIKKYPHAKILVILPYGVGEDYINAEREIAEKWGVAYMSVGEVSGEMSFFDINSDKEIDGVNIRAFRRKLFTPDNTHPNTEGYKYLYTRIANKLFSI